MFDYRKFFVKQKVGEEDNLLQTISKNYGTRIRQKTEIISTTSIICMLVLLQRKKKIYTLICVLFISI